MVGMAEGSFAARPGNVVEVDGRARGIWYVRPGGAGSPGLRGPDAVAAWRTPDGRAAALGVGVAPGASDRSIRERLDAAARGDSGAGRTCGTVPFGCVVAEVAAMRAGDPDWPSAGRMPTVSGTRPTPLHLVDAGPRTAGRPSPPLPHGTVLEGFLAGLDPAAVDMAGDAAFALLECWEGIDGTFRAGAPLRRALAAAPDLDGTLAASWRDDPRGFAADMLRDDPWAPARRHLVGLGMPRWLAAALPEAMAAVRENGKGDVEATGRVRDWLEDVTQEMALAQVAARHPRPWMVDPALGPLAPLAALRADRLPRGPAQWAAYLTLSRALAPVVGEGNDPALLADMLGLLGADWEGCLGRFGLTHPHMSAVAVIRDTDDHCNAYAEEVLMTALPLAGARPDRARAIHVARVALRSGRTARAWVEASARWHHGRPRTEAASAHRNASWGAWLPAFSLGDLSAVPLADGAALEAEGEAMDHCVGTYAPRCLAGEVRVMGIVRTLPDGTRERVSTLEAMPTATGRPVFTQHSGPGNATPPDDALAFVAAYAEHLAANPGLLVRGDIAPTPGHGDPDQGRLDMAAWLRVRDAWAPHVPAALRAFTPVDVLHLVRTHGDPAKPTWLPVAPLAGIFAERRMAPSWPPPPGQCGAGPRRR